jgi:RNA polymerase sigma-70 factor, ECF subfamily
VRAFKSHGANVPARLWSELEVTLDVGELHDEYSDFVWRSLQRLGVPKDSLEDALQDVFIVVQRRLDSFDRSAKMSTWLFGICVRVAAAHRRRAHQRHEQQVAEIQDRPDDHPMANPEQAAIRREAQQRLERGLDALDLERRAVFVMFEIDRITAPAIAEMLSIPIGTVYSRLHRARADFSEAIARLETADGGFR